MATETQVYEVLTTEAKAQAVHDAIMVKLAAQKAAGNIISASFTRKLIKKGSV